MAAFDNLGISWADSLGYKPSTGILPKTGGSSMFDPVSVGLAAGTSVLSGIFGGMQQNRQLEAQANIAKWQIAEQEKARLQNLLAGQWAATSGKEFDQQLQQKAADYQQAFLNPRTSQLASEDRQRAMYDVLSPNAQKIRRQQNIDELNKTLATQRARTDAMFGQVRQDPFAYGNVPSYVA